MALADHAVAESVVDIGERTVSGHLCVSIGVVAEAMAHIAYTCFLHIMANPSTTITKRRFFHHRLHHPPSFIEFGRDRLSHHNIIITCLTPIVFLFQILL